ncbi:MAG: hypothetical protein OEX77_04245 [Candidatus Bathyarchaeota archaeon]|nr:hypothetical protein [Candidatus Bathyarchaeota archaeon]MDH5732600.1 hypothetical protein [Candidatus Bathyarchaeota archaeon]
MMSKKTYSPYVKCNLWEDFVQFSKGAETVVYNFSIKEGSFHVYAIKERIYTHKELIPLPQKTEITKNGSKWKFKSYTINNEKQPKNSSDLVVFSRQPLQKKLECGIPYTVIPKLSRKKGKWTISFKGELNPKTVSQFLSETLKISKDRVIEGDVYSL